MTRRLIGRPRLEVGLAAGLIAGVVSSILAGIAYRSATAGVLVGLAIGMVTGASAALGGQPSTVLRDLTDDDRAAVIRAVKKGEKVEDPRLAPGVIAWAEQTRRSLDRWGSRHGQLIYGLLTGWSLLCVVVGVWAGTPLLIICFGISFATNAWVAATWSRRLTRAEARLDRAESSARALLLSGDGGS